MKHLKYTLSVLIILTAVGVPVWAQTETIVDSASSDDQFASLVQAITAADLVETLERPGPFTVFAPVNEAFAALPAGTVEALVNDKPRLVNLLLAHVVNGKVSATNVELRSIQGSSLKMSVDEDGLVTVNGATVRGEPIEVANGRIYIIDTVLIPDNDGPTELMPITGDETEQPQPLISWLGISFLTLLLAVGIGKKTGYLHFTDR